MPLSYVSFQVNKMIFIKSKYPQTPAFRESSPFWAQDSPKISIYVAITFYYAPQSVILGFIAISYETRPFLGKTPKSGYLVSKSFSIFTNSCLVSFSVCFHGSLVNDIVLQSENMTKHLY